jgi:hypothetical protein
MFLLISNLINIFVLRAGFSSIKRRGILGYIVPSKFTKVDAGKVTGIY